MDVLQSTNRAALVNARPRGVTRLRSRALLELSVAFLLILLALWSGKHTQWMVAGVALAWIAFATIFANPSARELGLRISGMRSSLWVVGFAVLAAIVGVWLSIRMHTFHAVFDNFKLEWAFLAYIVWALVQQFILQDFFLPRLLRLFSVRAVAIVAAGLLFAVAHIPNPLLVIATLVWGIVACALFLRYRNLYILGLAHAIFGMCLAVAVPNAIHHQMRVGIGYWQWHPPANLVQRSQKSQMVSTDACVMADATSLCSARQARP